MNRQVRLVPVSILELHAMLRCTVFIILLSIGAMSQAATVFYLHGKIVEDKGDDAIHPIYGIYEYSKILSRLESAGHSVISEIRAAKTDRLVYADRIVKEIRTLIASGTAPRDIVVVGFSKGAQITILVSQRLARSDVRFVIQAVCGSWLSQNKDLRLYGEILSQYETSDGAGSCRNLFERSPASTCELPISTGLRHGAFYRPLDDWFVPQQEWIATGTCRN